MTKQNQQNSPSTEDENIDQSMQEEIKISDSTSSDWEEKYKRALADYQNLERRNQTQIENVTSRVKERILVKVIGLKDHLDRAGAFVSDAGLKLVNDEFDKFLRSEGVEMVEMLGKVYDPHLAECMEVVVSDTDGKVEEVILPTYRLGDRIIRVGMVKVGKVSQ